MTNTEVNQHETISRGQRAQRFFEDEAFRDAVRRVEARLFKRWQESQPGETQSREHLYFVGRALRELQTELQKDVDDGKIAEAQIARRTR